MAGSAACSMAIVESARLLAFAASFFLIAISPGLCMTLAMSLGIAIGVRRTLWMMLGEVVGIALVAAAALTGIALVLTRSPVVFRAFKVAGAAYLVWTAWRAWRSPVTAGGAVPSVTRKALCTQGFVTAVSNPKAWAFQAALLPPFLDPASALGPQVATMLGVIVVIEFSCLVLYAYGGRRLNDLLVKRGQGHLLNQVSALLMVGVALWLLLG